MFMSTNPKPAAVTTVFRFVQLRPPQKIDGHRRQLMCDWLGDEDDPFMPKMNFDSGISAQADLVRFAESCIDWKLMTYEFLPYFYGVPPRWRKLYNLTDNDPLFQNFLQAGMARVVVPVTPGFEEAALHLVANGYSPMLAAGGSLPALNSDIYQSLMGEILEHRQDLATQAPPVAVGAPWKVRVPTSFMVLQCQSGCVEGEGLPCNCPGHEAEGAGTANLIQGLNTGS